MANELTLTYSLSYKRGGMSLSIAKEDQITIPTDIYLDNVVEWAGELQLDVPLDCEQETLVYLENLGERPIYVGRNSDAGQDEVYGWPMILSEGKVSIFRSVGTGGTIDVFVKTFNGPGTLRYIMFASGAA